MAQSPEVEKCFLRLTQADGTTRTVMVDPKSVLAEYNRAVLDGFDGVFGGEVVLTLTMTELPLPEVDRAYHEALRKGELR